MSDHPKFLRSRLKSAVALTEIIKPGHSQLKPECGARGHQAGGFFRPRIMREFCLIPRARLSSGSSRTSHSRPWRPGRDRSVADAHGPHPRREDMPPKADMTTTWRQVALCQDPTVAPSWAMLAVQSSFRVARNCSFSCGPVLNSSNWDGFENPLAAAARLARSPRSASW
jgi:hypothetical protein